MPVDNSVALGVKTFDPADAMDKLKKAAKAVGETAGMVGNGMKTVSNAMPSADAPSNGPAFPSDGYAHK